MEHSDFRIEKQRADAIITLANGASVSGHFFLAPASPTSTGRERVAELLNSEPGFFPFQDASGETVLYNRDHLITIRLAENEARLDPGYDIATARHVSISLSNGDTLRGSVRVYRPEARDRLSDWARHGQRFRYIETQGTSFIVNVDHIVDVREIVER